MSPWGKYPVYKDIARFEYGRLLWKNPSVLKNACALERFQASLPSKVFGESRNH